MALIIGVYYKNSYWQLPLEADTRVSIGASERDTLTIQETMFRDAHMVFSEKKGIYALSAKEGVLSNGTEIREINISGGDSFICGTVSVYVHPKQKDCDRLVTLSADREYLIGRSKECVFCLSNKRVSSRHANIVFESGRYKIVDLGSKNHTFVNGAIIETYYLNDGDIISVSSYSIVFENGTLSFLNTGDDLKLNLDEKDMVRRYPFFRRSPRLGNAWTPKPIEIEPPPYTGEKPQVNWLVVLLPPLVMVAVAVASMVLSEGGLMSLLFILPMSAVTLLTTVISYVAQVRKYRYQQKQKVKSYAEYLSLKNAEIETAYNRQIQSANNANPETAYCYDIVSNRMRRLWERSVTDNDFLEIRLGRGALPLTTDIIFPKAVIGEVASPQLETARRMAENHKTVRDIAVTIPVKTAKTVGIAGNRQVAEKAIKNGIVQLTTQHSYADVSLIIVSAEKDYAQWSWTRWLPHVWDEGRRFRYLSATGKQAVALLDHFEDVLKRRVAFAKEERLRGRTLLPYLFFVITDHALTENREFLKLLAAAEASVGASALLLFDSIHKLPKECEMIVEFNQSGGTFYSRTDSTARTSFVLDDFEDYDKFARAMAPVRDRHATRNDSLPQSVTFFQGYGVRSASEINLLQNWTSSRPYKTLAAPIGARENGNPFLFDLHEKAHGPHGLVAGTTGSGKSEVLQTWILSMCAQFLPQDVSFVLIDFKGMGLAGTLKELPHIAGVISNVDEHIQRNLFSLESELLRRQKLFAEVSTGTMKIGDIYDYQEAVRRGALSEPLSHLIVVVDEFTELKTKFPDFMAAVDRTARVGRSLGIHLVLATQKPDGAVTDEMRANANFKWCLRMANDAESKSVIGRADAASIAKEYPGRAYIQIGNNEIFELIQTYYSGANTDTDNAHSLEAAFVDTNGLREGVRSAKNNDEAKREKEIIALVRHIVDTHKANGLPAARKVWEESLPQRICLGDIPYCGGKAALVAVIGITDDPRHQCRRPAEVDFAADGHLLVYGAPGTGKTLLLQTLVLSLAERYTPDEAHIYILDFGSWSMANLRALPHIGGVANGNEEEKIANLMKLLSELLSDRKTRFARVGVGSREAYVQATGETMPAILVIVDNFAPIRELYPDIENAFVRLSREGSGYGIYMVLSATSLNGNIGFNLTQNFKQALALRMTEKADYREIVGDPEGLEPANHPGRGLIRGKPPMEFQTALAVQAANDAEYVSRLRQRCAQIRSEWRGELPRGIPVMPEIVSLAHIQPDPAGGVTIGLSAEDIAPVRLAVDQRVIFISGTEGSGKTNMLRLIAGQIGNEHSVYMVSANHDPDAEEKISEAARKAAEGEKVTLLIDDIPIWLSRASYDVADVLAELIGDTRNNAFSIIAAGDASMITGSGHSLIQKIIAANTAILLGGSFNEHSTQFEAGNLGYTQQNEQLAPYCGYVIQRRKALLFKAAYSGGSDDGI